MYKLSTDKNLNIYTENYTSQEPLLLKNLRLYTNSNMPNTNLLTSPSEGRLLKFLVSISKARQVLEIGTFTGHASLCMAEALPNHGNVITLEQDQAAITIAKKFIAQSPHGHKITIILGNAAETLLNINTMFDLVFIDANKKAYDLYYELALSKLNIGGIIALDNMLWKGEVLAAQKSSIAAYLDRLNQKIAMDPRVENVLLPINDGWNLVRKLQTYA